MKAFQDLSLPAVMDTSDNDLSEEFFIPLLSNAIRYDRGVGFFSSGWLRINSRGMVDFARNGGRARWVTSPILDEADWESIQAGDTARRDPALFAVLKSQITDLARVLERDTLSALAWMVADEIITFKLALPRQKLERGDFHDKFGVFSDSNGHQVSFNGSYNDSIQGTRNYESIKIFCSWRPTFAPLVKTDQVRFERLWNNLDPNVRVFDMPEAAREQIIRLRKDSRPYPEPIWVESRMREPMSAYKHIRPAIPGHISLRKYQVEAIESWIAHDCRGLLEMATGTGKTITALAASACLYERERRLAVIITVPYQHLVDQWQEEAASFGYRPVLAYQSKTRWLNELNQQVMEYNAGYRDFFSVITTHTTFITPHFQGIINRLKGASLLIADEVHHLGAERSRESYPANMSFVLALSATPDRWFDEPGTAAIRSFFGETVFSFPLEKAIGVSLTQYYYYPHLVPLTEVELEQYELLSTKIGPLMNQEAPEKQEALKMLLIRRAELLNKAANKLRALSALIDEQDHIEHTLFYCAPKQIDDVLHLTGWEKGLRVHRFTAEESPRERQELLAAFSRGDLQALAAMRCLDEGVDVPSTQTAFILASSSNPREFIQRRGRILRKFPGKEFSVIHDLIAIPPTNWVQRSDTFDAERSIVRRELQRFKEFAAPAMNKHQALDVVWDMAKSYGLMDF